MTIGEIRDFEKLSFYERKAKLVAMKKCLYVSGFVKELNLVGLTCGCYKIIQLLQNDQTPTYIIPMSLINLILFCALSSYYNQRYNDFIEAKTIMNFEAVGLTLKTNKKD